MNRKALRLFGLRLLYAVITIASVFDFFTCKNQVFYAVVGIVALTVAGIYNIWSVGEDD